MSEVQTAKPAKTAPTKTAVDPAELLRLQEEAEKIVTPFHYSKPDEATTGKRASISLCKTDLYRARIVVMIGASTACSRMAAKQPFRANERSGS